MHALYNIWTAGCIFYTEAAKPVNLMIIAIEFETLWLQNVFGRFGSKCAAAGGRGQTAGLANHKLCRLYFQIYNFCTYVRST